MDPCAPTTQLNNPLDANAALPDFIHIQLLHLGYVFVAVPGDKSLLSQYGIH